MKNSINTNWIRAAIVLTGTVVAITNLFGQRFPTTPDEQVQLVRHEKKLQELQQALNNQAGYVDTIVRRWEESARASGKWDVNYSANLSQALLKLPTESLVAAGEASSYEALLGLLAGRASDKPAALSDFADDLVYTPVTPCRLMDTRMGSAGHHPIPAGASRQVYLDETNLDVLQNGTAGGCNLPYGQATAMAIIITVINPPSAGYLTAYGYGSGPVPPTATMIYTPGVTISTTTISPDTPGGGYDFNVYSSVSVDVAIDIVGFFAAPRATALDCTGNASALTSVAVNVWTHLDAACPTGYTVTGGGYDTGENTTGYAGVWVTQLQNGNGWRLWVDNQAGGPRSMIVYAQCCRVPGRP